MPVPADMQPVPVIIERRYVELVDKLATEQRVSRSRLIRDIVIDELRRRFALSDCSVDSTEDVSTDRA